ncbi:hypothetical protein DPMN_006961 [Dreissena polymorpha]|uniref:Uncharacterized protein n=2 Tax=Dreissena polymorpha TaxID=45954 RepID=A0A9D4MV98_DREPO|nr:hypothetical protein DPMN_006961 [Dreissena polymorpha]
MDIILKSLERYRPLFHNRQEAPDTGLSVARPDDCLLVAAIDFGMTYSGWGFSFNYEFQTDPTKISTLNWSDGKTISPKG